MDSFYGDPTANTSGQGEHSIVPPEIIKWNWGAFFLHFIWGIAHKVWISLLFFVPIFGQLFIPFVLGAKGNEWAWRNRKWHSVEHFLEVQRKWAKWGLIVFCVIMLIVTVFIVLFGIILYLGYYYLGDTFNNLFQYFTNQPINSPVNQPTHPPFKQPLTPPTDLNDPNTF